MGVWADWRLFLAAGLDDSPPLRPLQPSPVDHALEHLIWDPCFQQEVLGGMVRLGRAVEEAFGGVPEDIEGLWATGRFNVVQSRAQVL